MTDQPVDPLSLLPDGYTVRQQPAQAQAGNADALAQLPRGYTVRQTPQIENPVARYPAMAGSALVKGAGQTLDQFAGPGGDLGPAAGAYLSATTIPKDAAPGSPPAWAAPQAPVGQLTDIAHITNRPDLQPQNTAEQGLDSFFTGAGRAAPFGVFGAPVANAVSGGVGAVTGDAGAALFPNHPLIAEFLGNLFGGGGTAALSTLTSKMLAPVAQYAARSFSSGAETSQAATRIQAAMQKDIDSGAVTATDFANASARGLQPWQVDGAENTLALVNGLSRSGGTARPIIKSYVKDVDTTAPDRLDAAASAAFNQAHPGADVYALADQISANQKTAAAPLYDQAFTPSGIAAAPFKDQFAAQAQDATQRIATLTRQQQLIAARGNSGASGAAGAQLKQQYDQVTTQLQQAQADRQAALANLQRAQQEITANAPGAAASSAAWHDLQTNFFNKPEIQQGLRRGFHDMQLEAAGQHVPFDPTEYGVTGTATDAAGNVVPQFSQVPNMRMLDMAKRGLDAMIGDQIDATGHMSSLGRSLSIFRKGYMDNVETISGGPTGAYAQARAAWSGPQQSLNAIKMGSGAWNKGAHEIADDLAQLSPSDQALYRLGALQADKTGILAKVNGGSLGSNEAAKFLGNTDQKLKPQLEALFPDQASRDQLLQVAQDENAKFQARVAATGGSKTMDNAADVNALNGGDKTGPLARAAVGAAATAMHEPFAGMTMLARALADIFHQTVSVSPSLNANMARQLTQPNPTSLAPVMQRLMPMGTPQASRFLPRSLQLLGQSSVPLGLPSP